MASKFTDFILRLAEDPKVLSQFQENPMEAAKAAGLSAAEQSILDNPTPALISEAILSEIAKIDDPEAATVIVITYTYTRVKEADLVSRLSSENVIERLRRLGRPTQ
jgi:hypothetical protein